LQDADRSENQAFRVELGVDEDRDLLSRSGRAGNKAWRACERYGVLA